MYAEIVFPIPHKGGFTYEIPRHLLGEAVFGKRAIVPFGKRTLSGYIVRTFDTLDSPPEFTIKQIHDILDEFPLFDEDGFRFYQWLGDFYLGSLGEALRHADPYGTGVESVKTIIAEKSVCAQMLEEETRKGGSRFKILEYLSTHATVSLKHLQKKTGVKNINSTLRKLEAVGALTVISDMSSPKVREKTALFVRLAIPLETLYEMLPEIEKRSPGRVRFLLALASGKQPVYPIQAMIRTTGISLAAIRSLEAKGVVEVTRNRIERKTTHFYTEDEKEIILSDKQKEVVDAILPSVENGIFKVFLLHGVTGSGKTQVYIELAEQTIAAGKSVLILVPEISLTPQMTARLTNAFQDQVAVLHSRVAGGERLDAWHNIAAGNIQVVTGARSALFAPLQNIGLIVIDEEHDSSYKQSELSPRYHAREAAIMKAKIEGCPVLLGSATPSVESMFNAVSGKYELLTLPERIDNATLPDITIVDVSKGENEVKQEGLFSKLLIDKIRDRLKKKEGIILLQNRRGFSTQLFCQSCSTVEQCTNCTVSLVYHLNDTLLRCHYCGYTKPVPRICNTCGSKHLIHLGAGTQKVEDEIEILFPGAVVKRIDSDTMDKKGLLSSILLGFRNGDVDILVGTQIVAKGLDFARVTLVGVVSAETSLWLPDYRANERTFQLLTQVAGRAGRSSIKGEVIIQTLNPDHIVLRDVVAGDYQAFYNNEIESREGRGYPPYTHLCLAEVKHEHEEKAREGLTEFYLEMLKHKSIVYSTPPTAAVIRKIKNEYRYQMLMRSWRKNDPAGNGLRKAIEESYTRFRETGKHKDIRIVFDINPQSVV